MHQFSNPDLKHSSTQVHISNHSMTVIVPAVRLIGRHTACLKKNCLFTYHLQAEQALVIGARVNLRHKHSQPPWT